MRKKPAKRVQTIAHIAQIQDNIPTVIPTLSRFLRAHFIHIGDTIHKRKLIGPKNINAIRQL